MRKRDEKSYPLVGIRDRLVHTKVEEEVGQKRSRMRKRDEKSCPLVGIRDHLVHTEAEEAGRSTVEKIIVITSTQDILQGMKRGHHSLCVPFASLICHFYQRRTGCKLQLLKNVSLYKYYLFLFTHGLFRNLYVS